MFDGRRCVGVTFQRDGKLTEVQALKLKNIELQWRIASSAQAIGI